METKRYSAAEIAQMSLPGLPTTKSNVIVRAKNEAWAFVEEKGVGGTRRMYELPARYLAKLPGTSYATPEISKVVGHVAAGRSKVDTAKLELAMRALFEWERERDIKVADDRRPAVIALLYEHLEGIEAEEAQEAMAMVLRAVG